MKFLSMPDESKNSCPIPDDGRSKLKEHPNRLRLVIQLGFVVFSVFLCLQFRSFVLCLSGPTNEPVNARPPAVEAYLPISSLMSLTYLVKTCPYRKFGTSLFARVYVQLPTLDKLPEMIP